MRIGAVAEVEHCGPRRTGRYHGGCLGLGKAHRTGAFRHRGARGRTVTLPDGPSLKRRGRAKNSNTDWAAESSRRWRQRRRDYHPWVYNASARPQVKSRIRATAPKPRADSRTQDPHCTPFKGGSQRVNGTNAAAGARAPAPALRALLICSTRCRSLGRLVRPSPHGWHAAMPLRLV